MLKHKITGTGSGGTIWKYNSTVEEVENNIFCHFLLFSISIAIKVHQWWLEQLNINTDDDSDDD